MGENNHDDLDILEFFSKAFDPMIKKQQLLETAKIFKDLFDSFVEAGFTEDQAIKLLSGMLGALG